MGKVRRWFAWVIWTNAPQVVYFALIGLSYCSIWLVTGSILVVNDGKPSLADSSYEQVFWALTYFLPLPIVAWVLALWHGSKCRIEAGRPVSKIQAGLAAVYVGTGVLYTLMIVVLAWYQETHDLPVFTRYYGPPAPPHERLSFVPLDVGPYRLFAVALVASTVCVVCHALVSYALNNAGRGIPRYHAPDEASRTSGPHSLIDDIAVRFR